MQKEVAARGSQIRPHNRRLLLQLLRSGERSRAELAQGSGLSPAAVTNVAAELVTDGLVEERAPLKAGGPRQLGRPSTRLALVPGGPIVLGVQIGAGLIQVGVVSLEGEVLARAQAPFDLPAADGVALSAAIALGRRVLKRAAFASSTLIGIGVGTAGHVNVAQQVTLAELSWRETAVAEAFAEAFGVDAAVDHNVRAMAIGESRYGVGRGLGSLGFFYVRRGAGAGLMLNGRAYRSHGNGATEFGHVRVASSGPTCTCGGQGCLETFVSDSSVRQRMTVLGLLPTDDRPFAEILVEKVTAGDAKAITIRDEIVNHVGTALVTVVNLLGPEVLVLGGLLHDLGPVISEQLEGLVSTNVLPHLAPSVRIMPSAHAGDAGLVGAATLALDRFVFGENQIATLDVG